MVNESSKSLFEALPHIEYRSLGNLSFSQQITHIREMDFDIAVDLSGWTSGHFLKGFAAGLARKQVTYLGYFASTGLTNMDYWIGDSNLFPNPTHEWHTEKIWRLPSCFIAWNPPSSLVESTVPVPESSALSTEGIRFGSFNHHRKLSDTTSFYLVKNT